MVIGNENYDFHEFEKVRFFLKFMGFVALLLLLRITHFWIYLIEPITKSERELWRYFFNNQNLILCTCIFTTMQVIIWRKNAQETMVWFYTCTYTGYMRWKWNVDIGFSLISMIKYFFQIFTFYPVWFLWTEHGIQGRVLPTTSHDPTLLGGVPRADHSAQEEVLM